MINSIQNVREMLDAKIITDDKLCTQLARSPRFHSIKFVENDTYVIYMVKPVAKMNRPYAVS